VFLNQVNGDRFHELPLAWETLQGYPKTELSGKVVLVRLDLSVYFKADVIDIELPPDAVYTIVHLIICGARIVIASHWSPFQYSNGVMDSQMIAGISFSSVFRQYVHFEH
jgi:3-phosphoglycerate kinase